MRSARHFCILIHSVLALLFLIQSAAANSALAHNGNDECIVTSDSGKVLYDLRPLARGNREYTVDGLDSGFTFTLGLCHNYPNRHPGDVRPGVAQWQRGGRTGALGTVGGFPRVRGSKLLAEYSGGDACPGAALLNQSALISFVCDAHVGGELGQLEFVAQWEQCAFMFEWRTPLACVRSKQVSEESNGGSNDGGDGRPSHGAVAFVIVFVVGSVYILGGFLYNRVFNLSSGLRGIEQLPNYRFWRGAYLFSRRAVLLVADGATRLADAVRGRRGAIHIDAAEHSIRNEIFASNDFDDDHDALPFALR
ncbi:Cation-independent mannose-6-phosphate receptor CI-MPR [Coemansia sp. RSA 1836]|nr:Cation-independent mannose-6-phosphate receptor CI-MPR [Coemansia sp. RSA 1836]